MKLPVDVAVVIQIVRAVCEDGNSKKMELDPGIAERLFHEGGVCVCLDFPTESEFGIDMKSFTTGEKFNGVKMIPPGIHFIYYSVENIHGDQSPRVGFLHNFKKGEVVIKRWNKTKEELVDENDEELIKRFKSNLKTMDKYLGAYPFDVWDKWKNLSNQITEKLAEKIIPTCKRIYSVLELKAALNNEREQKSEETKRKKMKLFLCDEVTEDFLPHLEPVEGTELRFSKIPEKCYPENSTPSEITKHSLDSTYLFEELLSQHERPNDILGEIQLSFICFLIGYNYEAFEHWKKLIGILCSCDEGISKYPEIFSNFIPVLNHQLEEVQEDFLVDIVAGNNFVYRNLRIFFRNLLTGDTNGRLKAKAKRFQEVLTERLSWDFSDIHEEDEDELPVVVDV